MMAVFRDLKEMRRGGAERGNGQVEDVKLKRKFLL